MKKQLLYWSIVVVLAYVIVLVVEIFGVRFYMPAGSDKTALVDINVYANISQIEPSYKISSVFDTITNRSLFLPQKISIESIGVIDASIITVGIKEDGAMEVPSDPALIGWYKNGPVSGQIGNIVLAGHYDWYNGAKGVFYKLNNIKVGDKISISNDKSTLNYIVYEALYVPNNETGAVNMAFRDSIKQELTLITCGGVWDNITGSYDKRFLVKALLVE